MRSVNMQMKKMSTKLIAAVITLVILVTMTVSVSYAWVTISKSPSASGAQIAISGGNTILLAPDVVQTTEIDGETVTVHYPGTFSDSLAFSQYGTYDYVSGLAGLTPVSTSDGVYWMLPNNGGNTDTPAENGGFYVDDSLEFANLTEPNRNGHYFYLDFWVVSPGSEYYLRVSTDIRSNQGSALLDIPFVTENENTITGFDLQEADGRISSAVRVGFLTNSDPAKNTDTYAYTRSVGYDDRYRKLVGTYQENGEEANVLAQNRFTIYEPDGTRHTAEGVEQGSYVKTLPLSYDPFTMTISEKDVSSILTVQKSSVWVDSLDQVFQTGISAKSGVTLKNAASRFFEEYLQWQVTPYITTGEFFTNTSTLYANLSEDGSVSAQVVEDNLTVSGATDDIYIAMLERNTPQRIRMFVWIEGQDVDCAKSNTELSSFVLNLELAGADN